MPNFKNTHIADYGLLTGLFIILLFTAFSRTSETKWRIGSDVEGYYTYLPAVLIAHDVHHVQAFTMNFRKNEKGEIVTKYTCGVAYFHLPFFLLAHAYAHVFHYPATGFSKPYCDAMIIGCLFWAFAGLLLLRKLLLYYFSRRVVWVTLLCIVLGTNFFHYVTIYIGMSHTYSFTLVSGILLLTHHFYRAPSKGKFLWLAFLMGWLVLIRPTNCVLLVFILLFGVVKTSDLTQRLALLRPYSRYLLPALFLFLLPMVPQFLYWKEMLGTWVAYSYQGESFIYWKHPKIAAVLFDTQNGLFLYSPVLLSMFYGLFRGRKDPRTHFWGVTVVFVIITYLFASWWAWWFGAAFGHRCYIEYFPVLAFPIAIAIEEILAIRKTYIKVSIFLLMALLCYYNIGLSLLYDSTGIWDGPAWRWNWGAWWGMVRRIF